MPKFEIKGQTISLKKMLQSLGMEVPFDGSRADFSGIVADREQRLVIDDVLHQAFVAVDEQGTEAAAATAVTMYRTIRPEARQCDHRSSLPVPDSRPSDRDHLVHGASGGSERVRGERGQ